MASVKIVGVFDNSGYGTANKSTATCLINAGLDISTQVISTPMSRSEFAQDKELAEIYKRISNKKADVNIVQLIPSLWHYGFQKGSYNVGYVFWESDKICQQWVDIIENGPVDEIWVPCPSNKAALLKSGITKSIYVIPQYTKTNIISADKAKEILPIPNDEAYRFYSVFQWSNRKNPEALFEAYFNEFSVQDNVQLVVKTYGPSAFSDRRWIKEKIQNMKAQYEDAPPLYLFGELLTPEQVDAIAPQCQCYITTSRGEGWNLPLVEALAYKKQIITPKTGGIVDWMDEKSAYIIPHTQIDIDASTQAWGSFYQSTPPQKWGNVKVEDVQKTMRQAYDDRNNFSRCMSNYSDILKVCGAESVVGLIKERLADI
jgi:glycosyltransferase involved in cell wall biosynthesis